jgi:hypothetical protein
MTVSTATALPGLPLGRSFSCRLTDANGVGASMRIVCSPVAAGARYFVYLVSACLDGAFASLVQELRALRVPFEVGNPAGDFGRVLSIGPLAPPQEAAFKQRWSAYIERWREAG